MGKRYLIVGGAGFIGSHLADLLLQHGHEIRVYDSLLPQVHGQQGRWPSYLQAAVEMRQGDVRDAGKLSGALESVDGVFHLAARVGVGQSMYEIEEYVAANELGTATLLQLLSQQPVERLVVASSMSIYGEGLYRDPQGRPAVRCHAPRRNCARSAGSRWTAKGSRLGRPVCTGSPPSRRCGARGPAGRRRH